MKHTIAHIKNALSQKRRLYAMASLMLLILGTYVTVTFISNRQTTSSQAETSQAKLFFQPESTSQKKNNNIRVTLYLETPGKDTSSINGIDLTLSYDEEQVELRSFSPKNHFSSELINTLDAENGILRFAAVEDQQRSRTAVYTEIIEIGTLVFQAKHETETAIEVIKAQVIEQGNDQNIIESPLPKATFKIVE